MGWVGVGAESEFWGMASWRLDVRNECPGKLSFSARSSQESDL